MAELLTNITSNLTTVDSGGMILIGHDSDIKFLNMLPNNDTGEWIPVDIEIESSLNIIGSINDTIMNLNTTIESETNDNNVTIIPGISQ